MSKDQKRESIETGQQGTHEPWKHPGQASQDPNYHPDPDVLEKEKRKKQDK